ncbi:MAG: M3 family peptidase, partial [Polyangiaceae bacterium]|nr:M3 family peptidase [Polyangiaceae bacterium]
MRSIVTFPHAMLLAGVLVSCGTPPPPVTPAPVTATVAPDETAEVPAVTNPLLEEWTGPYGGVPPFDRAELGHFKPALEQAMAAALLDVNRIAKNATAPT